MHYQELQETVTLARLIGIVHTWTRAGADLEAINKDANDNPTSVVLVDHSRGIRATYLVGQASDEPEFSDEPEERDRQAMIDQAYAITELFPDILIGTVYSGGEASCWTVSIPALGWQPSLPYGYCYTTWQLLQVVEEARAVCQAAPDQTGTEAFCSESS